jgi:hypothetical protein
MPNSRLRDKKFEDAKWALPIIMICEKNQSKMAEKNSKTSIFKKLICRTVYQMNKELNHWFKCIESPKCVKSSMLQRYWQIRRHGAVDIKPPVLNSKYLSFLNENMLKNLSLTHEVTS